MEFEYLTKESKRAKDVSIAIDIDGSVCVTKPVWMPQILADAFVNKKRNWILKNITYFKNFKYPDGFDFSRVRRFTRRDYLKHKERARALVKERIQHFNQTYNLPIKKIAIRNHKSCWGTCSEHGNLNFNYKILFLPEHLRDYIIIHELCHIGEFNHSKDFWALVGKACPEYEAFKKELKKEEMFYQ